MILCDRDLLSIGKQLLEPFDEELVNSASIDVRIGYSAMVERKSEDGGAFVRVSLEGHTKEHPWIIHPKEFILVESFETLRVPNGYAVELKLKSSRAREGFNHSLAFWFDPGWQGVGTFEIHNISMYQHLPLYPGLRFGQIIVHRLSGDAIKPYQGRYQYAKGVEKSKG